MKNNFFTFLPYIFLSIVLVFIYRNWFLSIDVIGGDWPYYFSQSFSQFSFPPLSWVSWRGNGFGGIDVAYALHIFEQSLILAGTFFAIPWNILYKLFWFGGFLFFASWSSIFLCKIIFPASNHWQRALAAFFYSINTYILLVASGGQMGYALGYAVAPLVMGLFIQGVSFEQKKQQIINSILTALTLGFLLMIDIRVAYMTLFVVALYYLYTNIFIKKGIKKTLVLFSLPVILGGFLNLAWILPLVLLKQDIVSEVSQTYSSVASLQFFSFADFSHALGMLHPNWPENIFGKVSFMKWEFLLLPLFAFSSLLFLNNRRKNDSESFNLSFFVIIGLLGAFLAKGAQEPFGQLYTWLFEHIPGFVMFRDPTKWYVLVALSYSILVPFTLLQIYQFLLKKQKFLIFNFQFSIKSRIFNIQNIFLLFTFCLLILLIRPALVGELGGTFHKRTVPEEYVKLAAFMNEEQRFIRSMWIPRSSRFSYGSSQHRVVEALAFYNATSSAQLMDSLQRSGSEKQLQEIGVKYLIVPYDPFGEIFQTDQKYREYEYVVNELRKISWLRELGGFGKIAVFQTPTSYNHFYLLNEGEFFYTQHDTTAYSLSVDTQVSNTIIFSENYHSSWQAVVNKKEVPIEKTKDGYMQFTLTKKGSYYVDVRFIQQQYYVIGFLISLVVFVFLIIVFLVLQYTNLFKRFFKKI